MWLRPGSVTTRATHRCTTPQSLVRPSTHRGADTDTVPVLQYVLTCGYDPALRDNKGYTPLHNTTKFGASVDPSQRVTTMLQAAALEGCSCGSYQQSPTELSIKYTSCMKE